MLYDQPALIALDFDGVICDGMREYFQVSKRAHDLVWSHETPAPETLEPRFIKLRPVIETGWEMPLLVRAMLLEFPDEQILAGWPAIAKSILDLDKLNPKDLSKLLDGVRDKWIAEDLESWLALHRFYPGVIDKLNRLLASPVEVYIISTKEGRFIKRLLEIAGVNFPDARLFGKEVKQPKYATLRQILAATAIPPGRAWFVEDRLEALELIAGQPDLNGVNLYLADWGYNTRATREAVKYDTRIKLLNLEEFTSC